MARASPIFTAFLRFSHFLRGSAIFAFLLKFGLPDSGPGASYGCRFPENWSDFSLF